MRRTKILATLGPASANETTLTAMFRAGLDAVRLNFSHGTHGQHEQYLALVRRVAADCDRRVAVLGDLSGPKIRVGTFADGPVQLVPGATFTLTSDRVAGDVHCVSVSYPLADELSPGDAVLLDDGLLRLVVERVASPEVVTRVEIGGTLSDRKGINLPGVRLRAAALTDKDRRDLEFARRIGVDYVALSFVRSAQDVLECKSLAGELPVIAKIEKPQAVDDLEAIVAASDGVMVARGDLGVEIGSEKVPLVQKRTICLANAAGKIVITATQMLDSMIRSPRPTRAEAADVANAVLDGTDVLMLSGETASGQYPVEAVTTMDVIAREIECSPLYGKLPQPSSFGDAWAYGNACAQAAAHASRSVKLAAIVVATRGGHTADCLADYRPWCPIVAVTPDPQVAQRLALQWGVAPVVGDLGTSHEQAIANAETIATKLVGLQQGDGFAVVLGGGDDMGQHALVLCRAGSARR